ncbi:MAG: hypothetical protein SGJ20_08435 [Planctomycetota bacterium]|nr:hypothetical protein [Planctomycetota bacterium]
MADKFFEENVVDWESAKIYAAMTERERLQVAWGMWRSARKMVARIVAAEHPELSAEEQNVIVARRMSGGS